jgi:hypothetical protein
VLWNLLTFLLLSVVSFAFLVTSGVDPTTVNLRYEVGVALITGAVFALLSGLLSRNPNREILEELREVKAEVVALREQVDEIE